MAYEPKFSRSALEFFSSLSARKQQKLIDRADQLAADPFVVADFRFTDDDGRTVCVILADEFLFTFWVDHPAKRVLITDIELEN